MSSSYGFFKHLHLNQIPGLLNHTVNWLTASFSDVTLKNSKFNSKNEGIVIYCVHGTFDRCGAFLTLAEYMLNEGEGLAENISCIRLITFENRFQGVDIKNFAEQLKNKISEYKDKHIILLGHSRGGLVAAYFAEFLAPSMQITLYAKILLCAPFGGSGIATFPFTYSDSVKQMQSFSAFLKELAAKISKTSHSYFYIAAEKDSVVAPHASCIPEHTDYLREFKDEGHISIMSSKKVALFLQLFINKTVEEKKVLLDSKDQPKESKLSLRSAL